MFRAQNQLFCKLFSRLSLPPLEAAIANAKSSSHSHLLINQSEAHREIHTKHLFSTDSSNNNDKKMAQLLAGEKIVLKDGSKVDAGDYLKDKVVALYFSAMWCPPCRAFTPKLKAFWKIDPNIGPKADKYQKFYEELEEAGKNFEVVFVSRDRAPEDLKEYYNDHHGPWVYLEFGNPKIQELLEQFQVKTIPTCRVIKPDGTVVVVDARTEIQEKGVENASALWEDWMSFYEA